jgi:hypothetical protein
LGELSTLYPLSAINLAEFWPKPKMTKLALKIVCYSISMLNRFPIGWLSRMKYYYLNWCCRLGFRAHEELLHC